MEELDSVEPTRVLAENTDEHEGGSTGSGNKIILPDPFADIPATAMVATKMAVSPRIVLTIVETVPVYMTVITTTEPAAEGRGKWIVRRHRLLRLVENGYVNASSLLLAGGVASEQERSIVLSLEVGRFKWRRPQSKLYGTWIPLPRARALAATCSLNHRLGPFLNDNLESYFPAPLPTSFIRHLIMPFFPDQPVLLPADNADTTAREAGLGIEFQHLVNATVAGRGQTIARSSTFGATARGTPSPSIIQTLAARGASGFGGPSAKALFGADERQLNSLLQLLSAEGPMLGAAAMAGAVPENSPETAATAQPSPPEEKATETPQTPMSATGTELRRVTEVLAQSSLDSDAGSKSAAETQPATDRQPTPAPAAEAVGVGVGVGVGQQQQQQQQQTTPRPQLKQQQQQRPPSPSPGGAARPPMRPPPPSGGGPLARPPATPGSSPGGMRRPPMRPPPGNPAAMRGPPRPLSRPPSSWRPASPSNGAMQPSPRPSGPPRPPPARPGQGTPVRRPPPVNGQRPPINGRPVPRRPPPPPLVKPRGSPIPGAAPRPPTPSPAAAKEKPAEPRISPPTLRSRQSKSSG
ncbi:hypothetical protein H4R22_004018 [Coemansia sp. RSA 1290]|nr:hypothetical protein H4R22_004018 [Coemansia sp. RSA 1290]